MGKLSGLLSSGIGLAMEASSRPRSPNRSATRTKPPSSNRQELSPYEPPPRYEGYAISDRSLSHRWSYDSERVIQEDQKEAQDKPKYSTYGKRSKNVYDEESGDSKYTTQSPATPDPYWQPRGEYVSSEQPYSSSCPNWLPQAEYNSSEQSYYPPRPNSPPQGDNFSHEQPYSPQFSNYKSQREHFSSEKDYDQDYPTPSVQRGFQPGLSDPVIIPQRRPGDRSRGWIPAYAPSLQGCGIDQAEFLQFLESFNEASKSSAALDAVNVAALGVGFAPGIAPMVVSMVVPIAVRVAKTKQTESGANSFITRANRKLFALNGLFAMVMTFKPSDKQLNERHTGDISPQLPSSAPLIYFPDRPTPGAQGNQFQQMSHFVADYHDRRAQAKAIQEQPDAAQVLGPAPSFRSRWGDPNNPATNGGSGLRGMVTGQESTRRSDRKDRRQAKKEDKRSSKGPGLIGGLKGMVVEKTRGGAMAGVNQNQSLIKGIKNIGMQNDLLYLMIVNDPKSHSSRWDSSRKGLSYGVVDAAPRDFNFQ